MSHTGCRVRSVRALRPTAGLRFVRLALDAVAKANAALAKRLKARRMTWPSVLSCFRVSRCISRVARPSHGRLADAVGGQKPAISPAASCRAGRAEWATPRARNQWEPAPIAGVSHLRRARPCRLGALTPTPRRVPVGAGRAARRRRARPHVDRTALRRRAAVRARWHGGTVGGGCGLCGARARARLCVCECL